jgi:hypothetical protein
MVRISVHLKIDTSQHNIQKERAMNMIKQKWVTVFTHRSYKIKVLNGATHDIGYIIDDPAFMPDYKRYNTVAEAVEAIDKATK